MTSRNKVSLLCRYGGNLVEESGKVSYKDGTNRMILLGAQEINYHRLLSKVLEVCKWTNVGSIKYKHPELGLDCLVSVENDEDLLNMMQAFETQNNGPIQLFVSEAQQALPIHNTIPSLIWSSNNEEIAILPEETRDERKEMPLQNNSDMDVDAETAGMPTDMQVGVDEFEKLCEDIRRTNPRSRVNLQGDNHLKLFVSYEAAVIPVFRMACKPVVQLAAVKIGGKRPFVWFMAGGADTDSGGLLRACGFMEFDHEEHMQDGYKWFCSELFHILGGISNLAFVVEYGDEGGALEEVRAIFPHSHCRYCQRSFKFGIRNKFDELSVNFVCSATRTLKQSEFKEHMRVMRRRYREAWEFLRNIKPEYWARSHFKGACLDEDDPHLFDLKEKIASELAHGDHESDVSVVVLVEHLHNFMMETFRKRVERSSGWTTILLPTFDSPFLDPRAEVQSLESTATRFRVAGGSYSEEVVDIHMRNCSCGAWQIFGRPCKHAEEVINKCPLNRYEYWDECYTADQYRKAYSMAVIHPLPRRLEKKEWLARLLKAIFYEF